jgi:hypothetical protein
MADTEKPELAFAFEPVVPTINDDAAAVLLRILQQHTGVDNDFDVESNTRNENSANGTA